MLEILILLRLKIDSKNSDLSQFKQKNILFPPWFRLLLLILKVGENKLRPCRVKLLQSYSNKQNCFLSHLSKIFGGKLKKLI